MKFYKSIESLNYKASLGIIEMQGWCMDQYGYGCDRMEVKIGGKEVPFSFERINRPEVIVNTLNNMPSTTTVGFKIVIENVDPETFTDIKLTAFFTETEGQNENAPTHVEELVMLNKSRSAMKKFTQKSTLQYHVDVVKIFHELVTVHGWANVPYHGVAKATVYKNHEEPVDQQYFAVERRDVAEAKAFPEEEVNCGFDINFMINDKDKFYLKLEGSEDAGSPCVKIPLDYKKIKARADFEETSLYKLKAYYQKYGFVKTVDKIWRKMNKNADYVRLLKTITPNKKTLMLQREKKFEFSPLISIAIPLYKTNETFLKVLIDSIREQTYSNWQLCLADGSGDGVSLEAAVKAAAGEDFGKRILYKNIGENLGIAGNTNVALSMATGDYIALCDHDDFIPAHTLYRIVTELNKDREIDVLYTDEDKVSYNGKKFYEPNFKTDFNIDMLTSVNYICHLFMVRRDILDQVKGMDSAYDGAQDYDFIFRCTEIAHKVFHVQEILYHWRASKDSTSSNPKSKMYAFEAGVKAINAHYERMGLPAHVIQGERYGMYKTIYEWEGEPLVSVLIPNKDHSDDLDVVLKSLFEKCTYKNLEVIVIENNSTEDKTWEYYKEAEARYGEKLRIVKWDSGFNYSLINNFGETFATGEYLLLLNNDVEFINPDSIQEMLGYCRREDVGAVGARLRYFDGSYQHCGVIIGLGGVAGHAFLTFKEDEPGYMGRIIIAQDYSCCTAACLMVKRSVFQKIGGFDQVLQVAFNDVDLCLRIREAGYLIVYNPQAELYHYESKSRGYEDTAEKQVRFAKEIAYFRGKWMKFLEMGDPYYSPYLTLDKNNFQLRTPDQIEVKWES